ncbi:hypothetical protein HDU98_004484 [Podochytrium sp. JEL0797]|nr:hypothetical protein HDU98_004484 [Podochytrium sp. JEL0797]
MLNSYFVVPNGGMGHSVAASYLGGTGNIGYENSQAYPDGGDIRIVNNGDGGVNLVRGGGVGSSSGPGVSRKLRSVGGGNDSTRNVMGLRSKSTEELQLENEQLRNTVDFLSKRLSLLEKADQENNMLKSSIIQFRQDVQRQAKRYGVPSASSLSGSTSPGGPFLPFPRHFSTGDPPLRGRPINASPSSSGMLHSQGNLGDSGGRSKYSDADAAAAIARVSALEEELQTTKSAHEKQIEELIKYKERWLKVKDSARRKKEGKAAGATIVNGDEADGSMEASLMTVSSITTVGMNRAPSILGRSSSPTLTPSPIRKSSQHEHPPAALISVDPFSSSIAMESGQVKTPLASTIGFPATLQPPPPTATRTLAASIVMDSSAALLSSQLLDPSAVSGASGEVPNRNGSHPLGSGGTSLTSRSSTNRSVNNLRGGQQTSSGGAGSVGVGGGVDLGESGVSSASLFYSTHTSG